MRVFFSERSILPKFVTVRTATGKRMLQIIDLFSRRILANLTIFLEGICRFFFDGAIHFAFIRESQNGGRDQQQNGQRYHQKKRQETITALRTGGATSEDRTQEEQNPDAKYYTRRYQSVVDRRQRVHVLVRGESVRAYNPKADGTTQKQNARNSDHGS